MGAGGYEAHWRLQRMKVAYRKFEAAMEFISSMKWEKEENWSYWNRKEGRKKNKGKEYKRCSTAQKWKNSK